MSRLMEIACFIVPKFMLACELAEPACGRRSPQHSAPSTRHPLAMAVVDERVVLEVSVAAEQSGVRAGQRLREALAHSPYLITVEARPALYRQRFAAMLDAVECVSPVVEPGPLGVAYIDLRGLDALFPQPGDLPRALLACIPAALHPQVGIGRGKFPALVAAYRAGPGRVYVLPGRRVAAALAPVSIELLPAGQDVKRRLRLLGLGTLGALASLPKAAVAAQFGLDGARIWELARGRDPDPVRPRSQVEVITRQMAFEVPVVSREAIIAAAGQLLGQSLQALSERQCVTRRAVLRLTTECGRLWERTVTFKEAAGGRTRIWVALKPVLEAATFPAPIVELVLELGALAPAVGRQQPLWIDSQTRQRAHLQEALRQLKARYGTCPVGHVVEVEPWSRIPERRVALLDYDP